MKKVLIFFMVITVLAALLLGGCTEKKESGNDSGEQTVVENPDSGAAEPEITDHDDESDIENNVEADPGMETEVENKDDGKQPAEAVDKNPKDQKKPQTKPAKPSGDTKKEETPSISWPSNEYTNNVPRPSAGTLQETGFSDGIYCLRLTGTSISDAKSYAASLMNSGYTSDVSETISGGTYLFGGGNSNGVFTVVSFKNGQMIVGIQL